MTRQAFKITASIAILCIAFLIGCGKMEGPTTMSPADQARRAAENDSTTMRVDQKALRQQLGTNEMAKFLVDGNDIVEANLFRSGLRSVGPLKGLPLRGLDLGFTYVSDLKPLTGMPLENLILENTPVSDLSALKGMPLKVLKIQNTKVTDFSFLEGMKLTHFNVLNVPFNDLNPLRDMPLDTLWLTGSRVTDLTPLSGTKLVSLDVAETEVSDLTPVGTISSLKRLNIAKSSVSDLSPLAGLSLERIVLSPERIRTGIDAIRNMKSLVYIQTEIEQNLEAGEFWKRYDLGIWDDTKQSSKTDDESGKEQPATGNAQPAAEEKSEPAADKTEPAAPTEPEQKTP